MSINRIHAVYRHRNPWYSHPITWDCWAALAGWYTQVVSHTFVLPRGCLKNYAFAASVHHPLYCCSARVVSDREWWLSRARQPIIQSTDIATVPRSFCSVLKPSSMCICVYICRRWWALSGCVDFYIASGNNLFAGNKISWARNYKNHVILYMCVEKVFVGEFVIRWCIRTV